MKRIHIALGVKNIADSIEEYSKRLGCKPCVVIPHEYALWRNEIVNFSIRKTNEEMGLRHLGWEDDQAEHFTTETDVNGIKWERFTSVHQAEEIHSLWPEGKQTK